jgi:electron transfer flavoprotein alpha subunit
MILGLVEHDRGKLNELSLQMLTLGRGLAGELDVPLHAILIGGMARPLAAGLAAYGVAAVHLTEDTRLDEYAPEAWAQCVAELMGATAPRAVLAAGTDRGHEVMAHVAARTDLPLATNCIEVRPGTPYEVTRARWGGSLLEEAQVTGTGTSGATPLLLTIAPHAVAAAEAPVAAGFALTTFSPTLGERDLRVRVVDRVEAAGNKVALGEAKIVVGGGRGVGSAEGFAVLQELADLLGGAVGCSRAVTSLGWRPHADQVGQTGTRIAPDVYIACGVSGAIQHMVGCKGAKCLVAINTDPEAPIMAEADYAIVGDLHHVVPALCDALRKAQASA